MSTSVNDTVIKCYTDHIQDHKGLKLHPLLSTMATGDMTEKTLLHVEGLNVIARGISASRELLHQASFTLKAGGITAIIGESGSGKTILTRALTNLFPANKSVLVEGSVMFDGSN